MCLYGPACSLQNCWNSQENQKAKKLKPKSQSKDNDNGNLDGAGESTSVRNEIVWRLCSIKAKCPVYIRFTLSLLDGDALNFYLHVSQLRHTATPLNNAPSTTSKPWQICCSCGFWQTIINMWHTVLRKHPTPQLSLHATTSSNKNKKNDEKTKNSALLQFL